MTTPSELVIDAFAQAKLYADEASTQLTTFVDRMNDAVQLAPLVDVSFSPVEAPTAATVPDYTAPAEYSSDLIVALTNTLTTRLAGGTGLAAADETAIWDRAREREAAAAQAAIDTISREVEVLGYELPPGVMLDSIRRETRSYYDKVGTISRDIAIKQAELEQANMQKSIDQVIAFEGALAQIVAGRASMSLEEFKAAITQFQAEVDQEVKYWEVQIKQYEAQVNYTMAGQKLNSEVVRANLATVLEAGKIGAQVYSQLTASAYSLIRASASVSAGATNSVSYSYGNDTATAPASVTAV